MNRGIKIATIIASIFGAFGSASIAYIYTQKQTAQEFVTENEDFSKYDSQIMQFSDEFKLDFENGTDDYRNSTIASIVSSWSISQLQLELSYNASIELTNLNNQEPEFYLNSLTYDNKDYNKNTQCTVIDVKKTSTSNGTFFSYKEIFNTNNDLEHYSGEFKKYSVANIYETDDATVRVPDMNSQIDGTDVSCQYCFFSGWETDNTDDFSNATWRVKYLTSNMYDNFQQNHGFFNMCNIKHSFLLQNLFN